MTAGRGGGGSATLLERRYRRWLLAYPADFRRERGDELIGTLLDLADPGRDRPRAVEVLALLRAAAAQRLVPRRPGARPLAVLALALALLPAYALIVLAPAASNVCAVFVQPGDSASDCPGSQGWLEDWAGSIILNQVGWGWLGLLLVVSAIPVLLRGRRTAVLVAALTTLLLAPALPALGLPFLPSLAVTWLRALSVVRPGWMAALSGREGRRAA